MRKGKGIPVDKVLKFVGGPPKLFGDDIIKMNSDRYYTFKKSCVCVNCGLEGTRFYKERFGNVKTYHLNLYGVKDGKEVLMTKDHIVPKSKGGANHISNYQTMCVTCNMEKADKVE